MGKSAAERMRNIGLEYPKKWKIHARRKTEKTWHFNNNRSSLKKKIDRENDKLKKRRQREKKKALAMKVKNQDGYSPYNSPQTLEKVLKKS